MNKDTQHMTAAPRGRRRTYFVRPAFQWKFAISVVLIVFAVSAMTCVLAFGVFYQQARAASLDQPTTTFTEIMIKVVGCALLFALAPAVAFALWSVVFTHRICGPLFVLDRALGQIVDGSLPQSCPLRKNDEFKDLLGRFWEAVTALRIKRQSEHDLLARLSDDLRTLRADPSRPEKLERVIADVETLQRDSVVFLGLGTPDSAEPSAPARANADKNEELAEIVS